MSIFAFNRWIKGATFFHMNHIEQDYYPIFIFDTNIKGINKYKQNE